MEDGFLGPSALTVLYLSRGLPVTTARWAGVVWCGGFFPELHLKDN